MTECVLTHNCWRKNKRDMLLGACSCSPGVNIVCA